MRVALHMELGIPNSPDFQMKVGKSVMIVRLKGLVGLMVNWLKDEVLTHHRRTRLELIIFLM